MRECPFCKGIGAGPIRQVHFGDGVYKPEKCMICKGTGEIEVEPVSKSPILIIKPHGVWGT